MIRRAVRKTTLTMVFALSTGVACPLMHAPAVAQSAEHAAQVITGKTASKNLQNVVS